MAHFKNEPTNRFADVILETITKAEAADIQRDAAGIRKALAVVEKRQSQGEAAILSAVTKIGRRLDALEAVAAEADPTSEKSLEALRVKLKRAAGVPESCL